MNPKLPYPDFNYGYRYGFSRAELDRLHENATLVRTLMWRDKVRPMLQMSDELKEDVHTLHAQVQSFKGEDAEEKKKTLERQRAKLERLVQEKSNEVDKDAVVLFFLFFCGVLRCRRPSNDALL
jgi:septal ring factor EnvC (AmiA/AmiB activator)